MFGGEAKRSRSGAIGFGHDRTRILQILDEIALCLALGDLADTGEAKLGAHVLAGADGIAKKVEADSCAETTDEPEGKTGKKVPGKVRLEGRGGGLCPIDDRDRRSADPAGDPDLLVAPEKRIVETAIGVDLALQDAVAD